MGKGIITCKCGTSHSSIRCPRCGEYSKGAIKAQEELVGAIPKYVTPEKSKDLQEAYRLLGEAMLLVKKEMS